MSDTTKFIEAINAGYTFSAGSITLGGAVLDGSVVKGTFVKAPLSTMNRHGLIAGATGTGKTKTLQKVVEELSKNGVPTLIMDIKGDLSGISQPGVENPKITDRHTKIGLPWTTAALPVEFVTISGEKGARMRATLTEFGPVLFSKILELNDTQGGVVSLIFKYCDDNKLPLLDLKDFKQAVQYVTNEGKDEVEKDYGSISTASTGTIIRKIIELEQQGAELIFGEKSFEIEDLIRTKDGKGYVNVLRLTDMQTKPKLFSTFMMSLLGELYEKLPEEGDVIKPKLCIFIDEAHLMFDQASQTLLNQMETIIKLIRSKGVGIYFITQNPMDIPASILGQLGLKIQHALRAFTAIDRKAIKVASQNYPLTDFYTVDELLTTLGMGEAIITVLNEKGNPTPLVHCMMCAPETRMDTITDGELDAIVSKSEIASKYNEVIDRDSASEMLKRKIETAAQQTQTNQPTEQSNNQKTQESPSESKKDDSNFIEDLSKNTMVRQVGKSLVTEVTRGIFGMLGIKMKR